MSRIDEMIQRLCPDGVEYKQLGEVGVLTRGQRFTWKDVVQNGEPCLHYSEIYTHYGVYADTANSYLPAATYEKLRKAAPGDIVIVSAGETVEDIGIGVAWLGDKPIAIHDACTAFHPNDKLDSKYVSYFFRSDYYHAQITKYVSSSKISSILPKNLAKAVIPVPPLDVQREIVRVLDSFAELGTELEAELEARKAQYAHYRDRLLSRESLEEMAGGEVDVVELGAAGSFYGGLSGKSKDDFADGNALFVPYTNVYNNVSIDFSDLSPVRVSEGERQHELHRGDVLVTGSSETPDDCGMTSVVMEEPEEKLYLNSFCFGWRPNAAYADKLEPGFLKYAMRAYDARKQIVKTANGVTRFNISKKSFARVTIPVPPLSVQQHVVDILDRFDVLTTSLTDGLPAEIEARRKQYEYYRDRLLDFPRKEV